MATTDGRIRDIYLDIETQHWSDEVVGSWRNIPAFGMAIAVTFSDDPAPALTCWGDWTQQPGSPAYLSQVQKTARALIQHLQRFDRIITFNGEQFDFKVLSAYGDVSGLYARSFDLLAIIQKKEGYLVSLDNLASTMLGYGKTGDGRQAVELLRAGGAQNFHKSVSYCINDVMVLRDIIRRGRRQGLLRWTDKHRGCEHRISYEKANLCRGEGERKAIILTVGLPRSGKSTWARAQECPIVSRDSIRLAILGQAYIAEREAEVTVIEDAMVDALIMAGHERVIIDACHCTFERRDRWEQRARERGWAIRFETFYADSETCIQRAIESDREDLIPVIERMAQKADFLPESVVSEREN